jgi:hypothetical protein
MNIEFLRRPENLRKIQVLDENFENKEIQASIKDFFTQKGLE